MAFLYSISNLAIPLLLLVYKSLVDFHDYRLVSYGKWALMIVLIFFSNLIYWIFDDSIIFLLIDMTIKCGIVFLPQNLEAKIQKFISGLHLQIMIDKIRCSLLNKFHMIHWKLTEYALSKLDTQQQKQFKTALIQKLNGMTQTNQHKSLIQSKYKVYQNTGINCTILSEETMKKSDSTRLLQQWNNSRFLQSLQSGQGQQNYTFSFTPPTKEEVLPKFNYEKPKPVISNKSKIQAEMPNFALKQSSQKFHLDDFGQSPIKPIKQTNKNIHTNLVKKQEIRQSYQVKHKQISDIRIKNQEKQKIPLKRTFTMGNEEVQIMKKKNNFKQDREDDESSQILQKLDISASQYSDMFQEDDEDLEPALVCKVEVILEIGVDTSVRLEIYKLQLYSNDDLRIVSLYDREFQRHKLISMKKGLHGYYELQLSGGNVNSRRVKFRGQYKAFQKYMNNK